MRRTRGRAVGSVSIINRLDSNALRQTQASLRQRGKTGRMLPRFVLSGAVSPSLVLLGAFRQARAEEWLFLCVVTLNRETLTPYRCIWQLHTSVAKMAAADREVIISGLLWYPEYP